LNYGCNACHKFGEPFNGPDLMNISKRRDAKWLKDWILDPESKYKDADIEGMRQYYKLAMPNQHVDPKDIDKLIKYMQAKSKQVEEAKK